MIFFSQVVDNLCDVDFNEDNREIFRITKFIIIVKD